MGTRKTIIVELAGKVLIALWRLVAALLIYQKAPGELEHSATFSGVPDLSAHALRTTEPDVRASHPAP